MHKLWAHIFAMAVVCAIMAGSISAAENGPTEQAVFFVQ